MEEDLLRSLREELELEMEEVLEGFRRELARIRTGRASASLLDGIRVNYYGSSVPLKQVASISVPESRLLVIQPWDKSVLGEIERAIQRSELGLNPVNDGKVIRLPIPPLTEERRKELVRLVRKRAEEFRVSLRSVRREAMERLKRQRKEGEISEDDFYRLQEEVQRITDRFVKEVDAALAAKERENLEP